ncbi:hypothetical protein FEK35_27260 [Nocardia cyriacigeorgica]|uniref:Uncharacterized protein n=1 Tax=Nocardia cyriacigeorgica TaxID=135487 RepID=A0A5R8P6T6_9NOCA|nr:hypothetical protein [Nocardia cyriacigeorgica]MBF6515281.1 hypothetical protein [Nocardia cyriacigeorgica]TLF96793.1 hypothetical protein FEK35_27260 [Nocardia cyriacigeorgica]
MDDFDLIQLKIRTVQVYALAAKILSGLDLPIMLTPFTEETSPSDMITSIEHARGVLVDLPMDRMACGALATAITDWLSAMVLIVTGATESDDTAQWMTTAALLQFDRAEEELKLAQAILAGEIQVVEEDPDKQ